MKFIWILILALAAIAIAWWNDVKNWFRIKFGRTTKLFDQRATKERILIEQIGAECEPIEFEPPPPPKFDLDPNEVMQKASATLRLAQPKYSNSLVSQKLIYENGDEIRFPLPRLRSDPKVIECPDCDTLVPVS